MFQMESFDAAKPICSRVCSGQAVWVRVSQLLGASVLKGLYEPVSRGIHPTRAPRVPSPTGRASDNRKQGRQAGLGWAGVPVGPAEGSSLLRPLPDVPTVEVGGSAGSGDALCEERAQTRVPGCCSQNSGPECALAGGRPGPALPSFRNKRCVQGPCAQTRRCWGGWGCTPSPEPAHARRWRRAQSWDVQQGRLGGELLTSGQARTLFPEHDLRPQGSCGAHSNVPFS